MINGLFLEESLGLHCAGRYKELVGHVKRRLASSLPLKNPSLGCGEAVMGTLQLEANVTQKHISAPQLLVRFYPSLHVKSPFKLPIGAGIIR